MNTADGNAFTTRTNGEGWRALLVTCAGVCFVLGLTVVGIKALQGQKLFLLLSVVAAPVAVYALVTRPNFSTYLAVFLVYTNAPGVLANFHGVPRAIAGLFPALLLIPIAYFLLVRREKVVFPPVAVVVLLWLMFQAVSVLFAVDPRASMDWFTGSLLEGVVLFLLVINAARTPEVVRRVCWSIVLAGAFVGAVVTHQYVTNSYNDDYGGFAQVLEQGFSTETARGKVRHARAMGPIGEQNRFAQTMLMLLPIGAFAAIAESSPNRKFMLVAGTALIAAAFGLAFSRGAVVGLGIALVAMTMLGHLRAKHLAIAGIVAMTFMLLLPQYRTRLASLVSIKTIVSKRGSTVDEADGALRGRATEMLAAIRVFADHPIVGVGPGMFKFYARKYGRSGGFRALKGRRQAHSLYLGIAAEHGILGLSCLLAILYLTIRNLHETRRRCLSRHPQYANLATGLGLAILIYMSTGLFLHFSYVRYFWVMIGLATAACCAINRALDELDAPEADVAPSVH